MEMISLTNMNAPISSDQSHDLSEHLAPEIDRIAAAWRAGYDTEYASLSLSSDQQMLENVRKLAKEKKEINPKMMILIGIGGSNLGTIAVYQALKTACENHDATLPLFFADTLDPRYISPVYRKAEQCLKNREKILLVIISKSGSTTETIVNAKLFVDLLDQYQKESAAEQIVFITDQDSPLHQAAQKIGASCLFIPKKVGGRFSVLSPVGLFPLEMLCINTGPLLQGALSVKDICTTKDLSQNPAALSAATMYYYYQKGMVIHDLFLFAMSLRGVGAWYRQLMAESIGKANNKRGESVHVGITPTTSMGSIDLHSVAQLYLAGPNNRLTTFVRVGKQEELLVPFSGLLSEIASGVNGKSFSEIMHAIYEGTQKAYEYQKRPFLSIEFPEISAYYLGQFLQIKMVEIMYLGYLFDINPFDQPQVELYKKETGKILAHE